jgi:hypothetical protein
MDWFERLTGIREKSYEALKKPVKALWKMQNGYALWSRAGLDAIADNPGKLEPEQVDILRGKMYIGVHRDVEVTDAAGQHRPLVSQAFCSALGGLHSCATFPLGSIRVAGSASGLRSHGVGHSAESTTWRIARRSTHAAWRGRLRQSP